MMHLTVNGIRHILDRWPASVIGSTALDVADALHGEIIQ